MKTYLTYFDETSDDGITTASSDHFILTSISFTCLLKIGRRILTKLEN